jgi:hypothetical protein
MSIGVVGIVNLTADTLIPEISLDALMPKIKGLECRKSRVLPIYRGFSHYVDNAHRISSQHLEPIN